MAAIDRAFAEIATVEKRISAHDPKSDLGRLFNALPNEIVSVHPWIFEVIGCVLKLHRLSEGAFDITVGNILERNRYLPPWRSNPSTKTSGTMADIELLQRNQLRLRRTVRLDLGGIAKGFVVDRAAEALIEAGVEAGSVNAGGDFRIFGDCAEPLLLRDAVIPNRLLRVGQIHTGAVATSSGYFRRRRRNSGPVTPLIDGRTKRRSIYTRASRPSLRPACGLTRWYLIGGDDAALPAIGTLLEALPESSSAHVFVEVTDATEKLTLESPTRFCVTWLHHGGASGSIGRRLEQAVREFSFPERDGRVWIGCEAGVMRDIRRHLPNERGMDRAHAHTQG